MKLSVFILLAFVSSCYCQSYNEFIKSLGRPVFGYASMSVHNGKPNDLKSDIMPYGETFALNDSAIDLFLKQVEIYPMFRFKGFPFEAYDEELPHFTRLTPDVRGRIGFEYSNGGKLGVSFEDFDEFSFTYYPPNGGAAVSKNGLLWVNSEMLSLVIYPLVSKSPSRWNWHPSTAIGLETPDDINESDLDQRISRLEIALAQARAKKTKISKPVESKK